jgi:hypothetical protein
MQVDGPFRLLFDQGVSLGLPVMPGAVPFVADWNNDGRKDLIVGLADGSVKLFINDGLEVAPAFGAGVDILAAGSTLSVGGNAAPAVVDYDGDGDKDLLVGNASGEVVVFLNQGDDAEPLLAAAVALIQVNGAVVPFPVDWDADGQQELLLTANGVVTVYTQVDGAYQAGRQFSKKKSAFFGAFPIALNGIGKQLLIGQSDGQVVYLAGESEEPVASFHVALLDKVDELDSLVADENPQLLVEVAEIRALVDIGQYAAAKKDVESLAPRLTAGGAAQTSAHELAALL